MSVCVSRSSYSLVYLEGFLLKLFEGNFHQGIKPHIIYFSLANQNIRTIIILFSVYLPSIYTHVRIRLMNLRGICDLFI